VVKPGDGLTCQELVELVTEYLDDALPPHERERFEEHLLTCPGCQTHLTQMQQTIRILGAASLDG
jgi:anti-sigma factor RsiW